MQRRRGQSFGAFIPKGLTLDCKGQQLLPGQGASGGKIIVYPPKESKFKPEEISLSSAWRSTAPQAGSAFLCGVAVERFSAPTRAPRP
jgi:glutamate synthase (ferredoxin)